MRNMLNNKQHYLNREDIIFFDEETALVECFVGNLSGFYSRYDVRKTFALKNDLQEFLTRESSIIPTNLKLNVVFYFNKLTKKEEVKVRSAYERHFYFKSKQHLLNIKQNKKACILLFCLSGILIAFNFLLKPSISASFLDEIFLIFSWFFAWEGTEVVLLNRKIKYNLFQAERLRNAVLQLKVIKK